MTSDTPDSNAWSATSPPDEADGSIVEPEPSGDGDSFVSFLKELPVLVIIALTLAFLLRTFVVQVFFIPSGSMEPTLQVNDRMVVEKVTYRFRDVDRGDIIVFEGDDSLYTTDSGGVQRVVRAVGQFVGLVPADARDFVKRVIGLPGDEVVIDNGVVTVNGVTLDEPYAELDSYTNTHVVPPDSLFVMGDNRDNSSDSRYSLGFIEVDDVVGRAVLRIWPFGEFGGLAQADYPSIPDSPPHDQG